jgi:hypothetical protein
MVLVSSGGNAYYTMELEFSFWVNIELSNFAYPGHECNHETPPGEEENATIFVDWVEDWDRLGFLVDRIHLWCAPESSEIDHLDKLMKRKKFVEYGE